ncbi:MAG: hypothetical protein ACRD8Z_24670 [Nitrososphaeraceae archaeon]
MGCVFPRKISNVDPDNTFKVSPISKNSSAIQYLFMKPLYSCTSHEGDACSILSLGFDSNEKDHKGEHDD